jgi:hypothetical protein
MAPGREVVTILDSDEDDSDTRAGARAPQHKPRDKTSQHKNNRAVVDLTTEDDDGPGVVGSSMPNRARARSPLFFNSLSRMNSSPRPRPAANLRATSPAVWLNDDEDELPDDPTPKSLFTRPAPCSDPRGQPKVASSSSSLRNSSHASSPNKRSRDTDDGTQRQYVKEKRRRVAADEEPINGPGSGAARAKLPIQSYGESRWSSPLKVSAIDSPSVAGAADDSHAESLPGSQTSMQKTSANTKTSHRSLVEIAEHRQEQRSGPRSELTVPTLDADAGSSASGRSPGGANKNRQTGFTDLAVTTPNGLSKATSRNVSSDLGNHGNGSSEAATPRKEVTTARSSTSINGRDYHGSPKPASPVRQSPPIDWTSAGASPSSQLHREAGGDFEEPDGLHALPEIELGGQNQVLEPELPTIQADEAIEDPVMPGIPIFPVERQVERVLGKYYQEMREDTDYFTKAWLKRSRRSIELHRAKQVTTRSDSPSVASAVFDRLRAAATTQPTTATAKLSKDDLKFNVDVYNGANKPTRSCIKAKHIQCNVTSIANDVPEYAHYVSLQTNILAPNTTTMTVWPYFGDGEPDPEEFENYYLMDTDQRHRKIRRLLEAQKVEEYIESALQDLHITWDDVLRFLLEANPDVGTNAVARSAILNRDSHREDFPKVQGSKRWTGVLSSLSESTQENLVKAAILCDNFQRMAKFPIWHVARRSAVVKRAFQKQDSQDSSVDSRICRVCLQFNCHQHGELQESNSDTESGAESDEAVAKDILYPQRVNFRKRVSLPRSPPARSDGTVAASMIKAKRTTKYWDTSGFADLGDWPPFYPCHHPGVSCNKAECSCWANKRPCEKSCMCADDCTRKFQGCACASFKHRKPGDYVCWRDNRCACYKLGRECDPDLCGTCGVCEVLDPVHRHDHNAIDPLKMCLNASIQKGIPKHTLLGDSGIHGMGLYAGQLIRAQEFVGEYKGEVITKEEADRRGAVYEKQKSTYLFSLNSRQEVDSNFYGNKIRFINHRNKSGANVYPLIRLVNTVHRIGLFAQQDIKPGEELFFDYGPKFPEHLLGGIEAAVGSKSAPHVRNANMVLNDFYDVEDDEDEAGNRRARKAPANDKIRGRPRKPEPPAKPVKPKGKMGGARPGAGRKPGKKKEEARAAAVAGKMAEKAGSAATAQDRFEAYYVSQDKDLSVHGDDGDDEDFVDGDGSDQESSEEEEDSEDEPVQLAKSRYGRSRARPGRM